jgi:hypothetical protein
MVGVGAMRSFCCDGRENGATLRASMKLRAASTMKPARSRRRECGNKFMNHRAEDD